MSDDETKIEPYYQMQAKQFVDCLFDAACLSESLSRDGMKRVEDLLALMFQQQVNSGVKAAGFVKQYKKLGGGDGARHEEEKRWIARVKVAEERVRQMEVIDAEFQETEKKIDAWHKDVTELLLLLLPDDTRSTSNRHAQAEHAARVILAQAFALGIAEPDLCPGETIHSAEAICGNIHKSEAFSCQLSKGHTGKHQFIFKGLDHKEEW